MESFPRLAGDPAAADEFQAAVSQVLPQLDR
ncbi:hypothetical protein SAMN04488107_2227 [Geodermatophilus saharensis]|uniref:Uncharacterized protein n=1 Tax=Geodermatophilus saharensis TaxID=1137994 RepID=A0A239DJS9_9ACTN|nr:hypothetical protein SAMN04488107_2227 [Geodermatophilus saharensis]